MAGVGSDRLYRLQRPQQQGRVSEDTPHRHIQSTAAGTGQRGHTAQTHTVYSDPSGRGRVNRGTHRTDTYRLQRPQRQGRVNRGTHRTDTYRLQRPQRQGRVSEDTPHRHIPSTVTPAAGTGQQGGHTAQTHTVYSGRDGSARTHRTDAYRLQRPQWQGRVNRGTHRTDTYRLQRPQRQGRVNRGTPHRHIPSTATPAAGTGQRGHNAQTHTVYSDPSGRDGSTGGHTAQTHTVYSDPSGRDGSARTHRTDTYRPQ